MFGSGMTRRELMVASLVLAATPVLAQEVRNVTDAIGSVEIPTAPKRIVISDGDSVLQPALALGLKPVGASRPNFTGGFAKWMEELVPADMGYIGTSEEPNFETILGMDPDLILMSDDDIADIPSMYGRYSQIAPTVLIDTTPVAWRQTLRTVADLTGRTKEADELLARYDRRVQEVRAKLGDKVGTATIARVRSNLVRYMLQDTSYLWTVLKDVGFSAPEQQEITGDNGFINISLERLDLLEADFILLLEDTGATGAGGMTERLNALPTFAGLKGEKLQLPSADYLFGNILTALATLDVLEARAA